MNTNFLNVNILAYIILGIVAISLIQYFTASTQLSEFQEISKARNEYQNKMEEYENMCNNYMANKVKPLFPLVLDDVFNNVKNINKGNDTIKSILCDQLYCFYYNLEFRHDNNKERDKILKSKTDNRSIPKFDPILNKTVFPEKINGGNNNLLKSNNFSFSNNYMPSIIDCIYDTTLMAYLSYKLRQYNEFTLSNYLNNGNPALGYQITLKYGNNQMYSNNHLSNNDSTKLMCCLKEFQIFELSHLYRYIKQSLTKANNLNYFLQNRHLAFLHISHKYSLVIDESYRHHSNKICAAYRPSLYKKHLWE